MLSTTLISVPVSKQVNKDVSIKHPFPALYSQEKMVRAASGGHISSQAQIPLNTSINHRTQSSTEEVHHTCYKSFSFPHFSDSDHVSAMNSTRKCVVFITR